MVPTQDTNFWGTSIQQQNWQKYEPPTALTEPPGEVSSLCSCTRGLLHSVPNGHRPSCRQGPLHGCTIVQLATNS